MPAVTDTHRSDTRADRVGQLVDELQAGVAALVTGAEWQRLLDVAARSASSTDSFTTPSSSPPKANPTA